MMKHLRGKHDQKDHGRRQFGSVGGGIGGSGRNPTLDKDILDEAQRSTAQRAKAVLAENPPSWMQMSLKDRFDFVRNRMQIERRELIQAQKAWREASKEGWSEDATRQAERFARAFGNYEGYRAEYNSALVAFQAKNRAAQAAAQRAQRGQTPTTPPTTPTTPTTPTPTTSPTPPSWRNLPRPDLKTVVTVKGKAKGKEVQKTLEQAIKDRDHEAIERERERVYNEYLERVKGLMLPDRGQFLSDGTYIPSERAIRIAREMQQALREQDGPFSLTENPSALQKFPWEQNYGILGETIPDFPDSMTPFSRKQGANLPLPTLLGTEKSLFLQSQPPKKQARKDLQQAYRDTFDRLGRFISPVDRNGNPTSLSNGNPIIVREINPRNSTTHWERPPGFTPNRRNLTDAQFEQERTSPMPNFIQAGLRSSSMAHEWLHEAEFRHPVLSQRIQQFLTRRNEGHRPMNVQKGMKGENFDGISWADTFSYLYSGMDYSRKNKDGDLRRNSSEVLTTVIDGMSVIKELRADLVDLGRFDKEVYSPRLGTLRDTEHFAFFIDVLADPESWGTP